MTQASPFNPVSDQKMAEDFYSGGTVAAKFPAVDYEVKGTVTGWRMSQQTDMDSGELMFFENKAMVPQSELNYPATARPAMQMLVDLQCEPTYKTWETNRYVEVALPEDDGARVLYVKGALQRKMGKALRDAGHKVPEVGAEVTVKRLQDVKRPGSKYFSYDYSVLYEPAAQNSSAAGDFLKGDEDSPFENSAPASAPAEEEPPF